MNELNCGQEEQYAGPEKKKSTSKIVKRTLVVAALALAVYVVYSVVYFTGLNTKCGMNEM